MGAPRVSTASMDYVRPFADKALTAPEGVTLTWRTDKVGSVEAAKMLAHGFVTTFGILRARDQKQRSRGCLDRDDAIQTNRSPYYRLMCTKLPLPHGAGWFVRMSSYGGHFYDCEITDNATGLPIEMKDERQRMIDRLFNLIARDKNYAGATEKDRAFAREEMGWIITDTQCMTYPIDPVTFKPIYPDEVLNPPQATPIGNGKDWTDNLPDDLDFDPFAVVG